MAPFSRAALTSSAARGGFQGGIEAGYGVFAPVAAGHLAVPGHNYQPRLVSHCRSLHTGLLQGVAQRARTDGARRAVERVQYASRVRGQLFVQEPGVHPRACAEEDVAEAGVVGRSSALDDRERRRSAVRESPLEARLTLYGLPREAVHEDEDDGVRRWGCRGRERTRRDGEGRQEQGEQYPERVRP